MSRLSFILILAVLALAVGFVMFNLSRSPQTVPYCEVARNSERFHNEVVRVRARLIFDSNATYIYEDCDPVEALASLVEMDGASGSDTSKYLELHLVPANESSLKQVDVVIEGKFNAEFSPGCWVPKYHIAARKVEQLSSVSDYTPPELSEEGPKEN
ncbi:MAG TPA: hypothetical protein VJU84_16415 [Pyrinomonadaceae bacterium]|nr:hypothetical protein [Pyrinomonadaceae bacterium]